MYFNTDKLELHLAAHNKIKTQCLFSRCSTDIIPVTGELFTTRIELSHTPEMLVPDETNDNQPNIFYRVNDMWDFDNIAVSRDAGIDTTVVLPDTDTKLTIERLLICGECNKGPIGFAAKHEADSADPKNLVYFLACNSISYIV